MLLTAFIASTFDMQEHRDGRCADWIGLEELALDYVVDPERRAGKRRISPYGS